MPPTFDYNKLFDEAFQIVLADYSSDNIRLHSEHDFLGNIFCECRKLMEEQNFPKPFKIHAAWERTK